jgi:hypothetical protein
MMQTLCLGLFVRHSYEVQLESFSQVCLRRKRLLNRGMAQKLECFNYSQYLRTLPWQTDKTSSLSVLPERFLNHAEARP